MKTTEQQLDEARQALVGMRLDFDAAVSRADRAERERDAVGKMLRQERESGEWFSGRVFELGRLAGATSGDNAGRCVDLVKGALAELAELREGKR